MKHLLFLACVLTALLLSPAKAQFSGNFDLSPQGCEGTGKCILKYDLRYKDPKGVEWLAAANDTTDGASIPSWAQPFVGDPFDKSYIKAAVIHDHYCDRHVRSWRTTHRVFYDALLELGVDSAKSRLMYYAVYLGGPKWVELIPGKSCGKNCLFKVELPGVVGAEPVQKPILTRSASYDQPGFATELQEVEKLIAQHGDKVDLEFLERRAESVRPNDFYYKNGDKVSISGGLVLE